MMMSAAWFMVVFWWEVGGGGVGLGIGTTFIPAWIRTDFDLRPLACLDNQELRLLLFFLVVDVIRLTKKDVEVELVVQCRWMK